jgi:hypothetical protein
MGDLTESSYFASDARINGVLAPLTAGSLQRRERHPEVAALERDGDPGPRVPVRHDRTEPAPENGSGQVRLTRRLLAAALQPIHDVTTSCAGRSGDDDIKPEPKPATANAKSTPSRHDHEVSLEY